MGGLPRLVAVAHACAVAGVLGLAAGCVCPAGQAACGASCTDLRADPLNCGACGNACDPRHTCELGRCVCTAGCGYDCTDPASDERNCGSCGTVCPVGATCEAGACRCPAGTTRCGGSCRDLTSVSSCGGCDVTCPVGAACEAGACVCPASAPDVCDGACVSLAGLEHCGRCGNACPLGTDCVTGRCTCPFAGDSLCGDECVDTTSDPRHCGTCGRTCASPTACFDGVCSCGPRTLCDGTCVQLSSSESHCGACGNACPAGGACESGTCRPTLLWNQRVAGGTGDFGVEPEDGRVALDGSGHLARLHTARDGNALLGLHDARTGALAWSVVFPTIAIEAGGVAFGSDGRIAIEVAFRSSWRSPGASEFRPVGSWCVAVVVLDAEGAVLFTRFIDGALHASGLAFLAGGELAVTGSFDGVLNVGTSTLLAGSDRDLFVAILDETGTFVRARDYGLRGTDEPSFIAAAPGGDLVLGGYSGAGIDLGGGALSGVRGSWIARLGPDFEHRWSQLTPLDRVDGVAVSSTGSALVSGVLPGGRSASFGGAVALAPTNSMHVVASYALDGTAEWAAGRESRYTDHTGGVVLDEDDDVYTLVSYEPISGSEYPPDTSLALVSYTPEGRERWYRAWGTARADSDRVDACDLAAAGGLVAIAGHVESRIDLGLGAMPRIDYGDVFYAEVEP